MKIKFVGELGTSVEYQDLFAGDTFQHELIICLKTSMPGIAISLSDGVSLKFSPKDNVIPINLEMRRI